MGLALKSLERLLLPNVCVSCERPVEPSNPDALVCGPCRSRLREVPAGCHRCRQPLPPVGPCRFCSDWPDELVWATSGFWLGPEAREIVHHLKYEGFSRLGEMVAEAISRVIPHPGKACLVPMPLSDARSRERGYNQACAIARPLSRLWNLELSETTLRRVRDTKSQTSLTPEQRAENVAGAFDASHRRRGGVDTLVLVDDVLTTGATIVAATQALKQAGWVNIGAVTFGRALPFEVRIGSPES